MADLEQIKTERQKVYGDPLENHQGIAQMWAPLLQPWADQIKRGEPVPPHVVALLMVALKLDRMRITYHGDNYDDLRNYLGFAEKWQKAHTERPLTQGIQVVEDPTMPPGKILMVDKKKFAEGVARAQERSWGKWPTLPPTPFSGPTMPSSLTTEQSTRDIPGGYPKWVKDHTAELGAWAPTVYVSGPYSAPTLEERLANCMVAGYIGHHLMQLGYNVFVPHLMTHWLEGGTHPGQHLRTDFRLLRSSDILFRQCPSVGSDAELEEVGRLRTERSLTVVKPFVEFDLRRFNPVKSSVPMTLPPAYGDKLTEEAAYAGLMAYTKRALGTELHPTLFAKVTQMLNGWHQLDMLRWRLFLSDVTCEKYKHLYLPWHG